MLKVFRIGDLAKSAELAVETIRYYEREGLLPAPRRSAGNFRLYSEAHQERLTFIRQCRALDMTLEEIRRLLKFKDSPLRPCDDVNALLDAHIGHISERIAELGQLRKDLRALRMRCSTTRDAANCAILANLSAGTATRKTRRDGAVARCRKRHVAKPI